MGCRPKFRPQIELGAMLLLGLFTIWSINLKGVEKIRFPISDFLSSSLRDTLTIPKGDGIGNGPSPSALPDLLKRAQPPVESIVCDAVLVVFSRCSKLF